MGAQDMMQGCNGATGRLRRAGSGCRGCNGTDSRGHSGTRHPVAARHPALRTHAPSTTRYLYGMRPVHIIGVSLDLGGNRRGVDMGPSAFRIAGLGERLAALGIPVSDEGDLVAPI